MRVGSENFQLSACTVLDLVVINNSKLFPQMTPHPRDMHYVPVPSGSLNRQMIGVDESTRSRLYDL
jgi:hypothetical protein